MRSLLVLLLIAAAAGAGYVIGIQTAPAPQPIRTVAVTRGSIDVTVDITGSVQPPEARGLAFGTPGTIAVINGKEGDRVAANAIIAQLDTSAIDAQARAASGALTSARSALDVARDAAQAPQPSPALPGQPSQKALNANVDAAQAAVLNAEAAVQAAQEAKAGAIIVAPIAGTLTQVLIHVGDHVAAGPLGAAGFPIELTDTGTPQIVAGASEDDIVKLSLNQAVTVSFDALGNVKLTGTICTIPTTPTPVQGVPTYPIKVCLTTTDPAVRLGLTADVKVVTAHKSGVLLVPNGTIHVTGNDHVVNLVKSGNQIVATTVQIGENDGTNTEILSGINEGDQIEASS